MLSPYIAAGLCFPANNLLKGVNIPLSKIEEATRQAFSKQQRTPRMQAYQRMVFFWLARKYTKHSLTTMGAYYKKNHATALHGIRQVDNYLSINDRTLTPLIRISEALAIC